MSRLKHFTRSIFSSYMFLGLNVLYTLVSIPLALKYLSNEEFGLWALVQQIVHYIAMVDLGMGPSIARILIDHKDQRATGSYGAAIKTGFLVCTLQSLIILIAGMGLVWFMGDWMKVSVELSKPFFWLMCGQLLLTCMNFITRMFSQILYAWQRIDLFNYVQSVQLAVSFGGLWIGFSAGLGIYSLLAGAAAGWLSFAIICAWAVRWVGAWPKRSEWGRVSRTQFKELFKYGTDLFLISIGGQFITASQTILISRQLGPAATTLWIVMTKVFSLLYQIVLRVIGNAMPAFAEMQVRREKERLWDRYSSLFTSTSVITGFCALMFAACNADFVNVWMNGEFSWPRTNDILLAVWLVLIIQQCCHNSIITCLKEVRSLKFVFIGEGLVFIAASLVILNEYGITGMLVCSLVATTLFTWSNGVWRIKMLSDKKWSVVLWNWQVPTVLLILSMLPLWLFFEWMMRDATSLSRLVCKGIVLSLFGGFVCLRYALPSHLIAELSLKLPSPLRRPLNLLSGQFCSASGRSHPVKLM